MREKPIIKVVKNYIRQYQTLQKRSVTILDLGCGNGDSVKALLNAGFDAYGCDFSFKTGLYTNSLVDESRIKLISPEEPYQLPFPNSQFDIVFSDNVLEHVSNIDSFFSEVSRTLKATGTSIHYYPSINKPIEPHVGIPLATRIQSRNWIKLWSKAGLVKNNWLERTPEEIHLYLKTKTHFRNHHVILNEAKKNFNEAYFDSSLLLRAMDGIGAKIILNVPGGPALFNYAWSSLLITEKNRL